MHKIVQANVAKNGHMVMNPFPSWRATRPCRMSCRMQALQRKRRSKQDKSKAKDPLPCSTDLLRLLSVSGAPSQLLAQPLFNDRLAY